MRKIGIAIPSYNRSEMTVRAFQDVYDDERVEGIAIVDDHSEDHIYEHLQSLVENKPKVVIYRNESNRDCFFNKWTAMCLCRTDWCGLWDSDNVFAKDYIDKLFEIDKWEEDTIYTPDFAFPHFNFTEFSGLTITKENVSRYIDVSNFQVMLNAANYFVNRMKYIDTFDGSIDPVTSDSIYTCMKWLEAGNKIYVVPGLTYQHTIHDGSHYKNNVHRTPQGFHESILQKLRSMV